MKRITVWQANDDTLHLHRADAVARDRDQRKTESGTTKSFLFQVWEGDVDERRRDGRVRMPTGCWREGGFVYCHYIARPASVDKAVADALRRLQSLRVRTGLAWTLDYEM